jgi:Leucine-rich repeat (LRR) protein
LGLKNNQLSSFNPQWISPLADTLENLLIDENNLVTLPYLAFSQMRNLRELDISSNPFTYLNDFTFLGLTTLERLTIENINLEVINPNWFSGLVSLAHLRLGYNSIREVPENAFNNLTSLFGVNLKYNQLNFIHSNVFGNSISTLTNLDLTNNRILAIDEEILTSGDLLEFRLNSNRCINRNFYNVREDPNGVREALNSCFENFVGNLRCQFFDLPPYEYECILFIMNPVGRNDFEEIEREHENGRTDADVTVLEAISQNSR